MPARNPIVTTRTYATGSMRMAHPAGTTPEQVREDVERTEKMVANYPNATEFEASLRTGRLGRCLHVKNVGPPPWGRPRIRLRVKLRPHLTLFLQVGWRSTAHEFVLSSKPAARP